MRTTATGPLVALDQENIMLRTKLQQAKEEIDALKKGRPQAEKEETGRGKQVTAPPKKQLQRKEQLFPAPPKQIGPGMSTKARDRSVQKEEEEYNKMRKEIQSLSEQVAALKEIVVQSVREEMKHKEATQQELPSKGAGETRAQRSKEGPSPCR